MKKSFKVLLAAVIGSCSLSMVSYAGTWQAEGANWKYQNDDFSYVANGWAADNGKWYYFDANGYMMTGWVLDGGIWYYLNPAGEMRTEPLIENGVTYYFDGASGACTNPDGAQTAAGGALTEAQYGVAKLEFFVDVIDYNRKIAKIVYSSDSNTQDDIQILTEIKAPFVRFYEIQSPARYAQAHERYKNGCVAMVQYIDTCIQMLSTDDYNVFMDLYGKLPAYTQTITDEFNAGDQLSLAVSNS